MSKSKDFKLIYVKSVKIDKKLTDTLQKLKDKYNIDVSNFIRLAIQEKISREYSMLIEKVAKSDCPF